MINRILPVAAGDSKWKIRNNGGEGGLDHQIQTNFVSNQNIKGPRNNKFTF